MGISRASVGVGRAAELGDSVGELGGGERSGSWKGDSDGGIAAGLVYTDDTSSVVGGVGVDAAVVGSEDATDGIGDEGLASTGFRTVSSL